VRTIDEKCDDTCPKSEVNSGTSVSVSKNTEICQTLEDEKKCYKSISLDANLVCLDEENATSIESYCGDNANPDKQNNFTAELCPENAISKISYHQCYNTYSIKQERTGKYICLNRGRFNSTEVIFNRNHKIQQSQSVSPRRNLNRLLFPMIVNQEIQCREKKYKLTELCV
jgi:hypothetical protein